MQVRAPPPQPADPMQCDHINGPMLRRLENEMANRAAVLVVDDDKFIVIALGREIAVWRPRLASADIEVVVQFVGVARKLRTLRRNDREAGAGTWQIY